MNTNPLSMLSGASLAMLAAGLAASPGVQAAKAKPAAGKVAMVHCAGVNSCKGHNDCKTAKNACAGQGSCKGQGFVAAPADACADMGGRHVDKKINFTASSKDFIHCMGANVCKGHNDCKTASNACKGQGSCKGLGFIALPASTCSNIGGKAG